MSKYASGTTVDSVKSRIQLEHMLTLFGADQIATLTTHQKAVVQFTAHGRMVRLSLPLPNKNDPNICLTATGKARADSTIKTTLDQEIRRRWRSLNLLVKAKITAIDDGIVEFEEEFLPHVIMANGVTVYERAKSQIAIEYKSGVPGQLMIGGA